MPTTDTGYAKINLALHVRERGADGYHRIETLFAFAEDGDTLTLRPRPGLDVAGPFAAMLGEGANLVTRAIDAFADLIGRPVSAGFRLDKRLPVAAGVGGGSADAAAALRLLCAQFGVDPEDGDVMRLAAGLGADVPACLVSRTLRGDGRGDMLSAIDEGLAGTPLLLVNPRQPLATSQVFAGWDGVDRGALATGKPMDVAVAGRNDLEPAAIAVLPVIGDLLALLQTQPGARLVRMSGSGATCFALFDREEAREAAAAAVAACHPDWWLLRSRLR